MRYKVGAEQVEQIPSLAHRPDGTFRSARTTPVGATHAVDAATGAVACGSTGHGLAVLDKTGNRRSSSRSAPAVSPPSSPTARRDQEL